MTFFSFLCYYNQRGFAIPAKNEETLTKIEDIIRHALSNEREDTALYLECQKASKSVGLDHLLVSLASQEKEHAKKLEELLVAVEMEDVFKNFDAHSFDLGEYTSSKKIEPAMNYNDLLTAIIDREEKAFRLYSFLSHSTDVSEVSFLFSTLAFEEQKHKSWAMDRYELEMLSSL